MKPYIIAIGCIGAIGFAGLLGMFAHAGGVPLLMPSGAIGIGERDLMLHATFLMLIVVVPVFLLIILIAWRYRAANTHAKYTPDWEHSTMEEFIWWVIPFEIVLVLGALTWSSTYQLDPSRTLSETVQPYTVQVVALPWKWLFIYPEEGVASVNELALPTNRPIEFQITADAPMNSFWIPALGGQMYAMTGMTTELNLIAAHAGTYSGRSANYSGEGFAQMTFTARAMDEAEFNAWMGQAKASSMMLTPDAYASLAAPSDAGPVRYYGMVTMTFADIVNKFMAMPMDMTTHDMQMPVEMPSSSPTMPMMMDMQH
jgi:cytochrome o ubiquinol oxidase subunit 2